MKNKLYIFILLLITSILIAGCIDSKIPKNENKDVDMISEIKYDINKKVLSFLITNKSNSMLTYGFAYTIEIQKVVGSKIEWILTNLTDNLAFIEMLALIEKGNSENDSISLSGLKEPFKEGIYRIVRVYNNATKPIITYIQFKANEKQELKDFVYYDDLYKNLSVFKGLELYVFVDSDLEEIFCGLLGGTNRNKTEEDFKIIRDNPVLVERMANILSTYPKDTYVFVQGLEKPLNEKIIIYLKSHFDKLQMLNIKYQ